MSINYPIQITFPKSTKGVHAGGPTDINFSPNNALQNGMRLRLTPLSGPNKESKEFSVAEINGWPETKTEMETKCVDLGWPLGRVCTDLPTVYHRSCKKYVYIDVTYPVGMLADVEECVKGAGLAAAVAAVVASPEAAGPAFEVALKGCLAAKGASWVDQVSASTGWRSACGDWHPV